MPAVLIIDDEPLVSHFISQHVLPEWVTTTALKGLDALSRLRQLQVAGTLPDLIILDIHLPDIDGRDICLRIRTQCPATPILPFTHVDPDEHQLLRFMVELGCAPLVPKGVDPATLRAAAIAAIRRPVVVAPGAGVLAWAQQKARLAELSARVAGQPPQVIVLATSIIDRHGMMALLDQMTIDVVPTANADVLHTIVVASRPTVILGPASEAHILLPAAQIHRLPVLLLARSVASAAAAHHLLVAQEPALLAAIVVADDPVLEQKINDAVTALLQGRHYVDRLAAAPESTGHPDLTAIQPLFAGLSPRLVEVVVLHALGWSLDEIAAHMQIEPGTVQQYWKRIYHHLGMNRNEVARFAALQIMAHAELFAPWRELTPAPPARER